MDGQHPPSGPDRARAFPQRTPPRSRWGLQRENHAANASYTLPLAITSNDSFRGTILQALQATTSDPCLLGPYACDHGRESPSQDFLPLPSGSETGSDNLRRLGYERDDDDDESESEEHRDSRGQIALPEWLFYDEIPTSLNGISTTPSAESTSQGGTGSSASCPITGLFLLPTPEEVEHYAIIRDPSPTVHAPPVPELELATDGLNLPEAVSVSTTPFAKESDASGSPAPSSHDATPVLSDSASTSSTLDEAAKDLIAFVLDLLRSNPLPEDEGLEAAPTWSDWLQNCMLAPDLDDECQT